MGNSPYGYIYIIENDVNSKLYVGRALDIKKRKRVHFSRSSRTWAIKAAIEKYGASCFDFVLLEACFSEEELNAREAYWILELNTLSPFGYNLKEGGKSGIPAEEVKNKMSLAHKGVPLSPSHRKAIGQANKGRKISLELKEKLRIFHTGREHSETSRQKMSDAHKGKKHSEETKRKMSLAKKGKPLSTPRAPETTEKIRQALLGRKLSLEHRKKISSGLLGNKNAQK